jgi:DNA repair protein RadA/Sms
MVFPFIHMTKTGVVYVCRHCGWKSLKWVGRCGGCGEWDSTIEEFDTPPGSRYKSVTSNRELPQPITQVKSLECPCIETGMKEFEDLVVD